MAGDNLQNNQDAIDKVLKAGQEFQSGRKRVRRPELDALHKQQLYLDKKDAQGTAGGYPGRWGANFNHS